jgi:hypothetical protein
MKLRSTLLSFLAFCQAATIFANPVTVSDAEKVARNFLYITVNKYEGSLSYNDIRLSDPYIFNKNSEPLFYAFQANPGFVIVSADDAYTPIIGYSFEGNFSFEVAPASYKGFLSNYADQIAYIKASQLEAEAQVTAAWTELRTIDITRLSITRERDVAPLLSCTWDQGSPYNLYCPEDAAGPGGHVWVGCVATAMAQIMYYWRYPENGTSQHCYTPGNSSYGQQCANFANTTYNWAGMINSVDNRHPEANALLQYHCAVAVNMDFGPNGSGSYSYMVPGRLDQYFRYNDAVYEEKQDFSQTNWINLLKADIDAGKPLYYSGYNSDWAGHAFVCDGYQGDNFHFNFGWSGSSNGYYSLYDVGGFNNGQACVRNFAPSDSNYPYYNTGSKTLTSKSGSITDGSGPIDNYIDNNTAYWIIDPQTIYDSITSITLHFTKFDILEGDSVKVYDGATTSSPLLGSYSGTAIPANVTSSANTMMIEFKTNGNGNSRGWYAEYTTVTPSWCQGLKQFTEPTATFDDGSGDFYYQSSATCMWRINPPGANKITLNFNYFDTEAGYDKVTVFDGTTKIAEFSGTDIPDPVEATSGSMFITWTTNNSGNFQGWEAWYEVDNVGISEEMPVHDLRVYPNPADDIIHISFDVEKNSFLKIKLVSITGQELFSEEIPSFNGIYRQDLQVGQLPSGFYMLEINSLNGYVNKKIVIN